MKSPKELCRIVLSFLFDNPFLVYVLTMAFLLSYFPYVLQGYADVLTPKQVELFSVFTSTGFGAFILIGSLLGFVVFFGYLIGHTVLISLECILILISIFDKELDKDKA